MSMSEYELSLVNDAKKGKKKSFERLCDLFHQQLVEVIEGELKSRENAETIIKCVTVKAKTEIKHIRIPADFERMIISLTIAECANFSQGGSDGHSGGSVAIGFTEQKNDRARAQTDQPVADLHRNVPKPFQPVIQNNPSAATPFIPAAQNNVPFAKQVNPAAQNSASAVAPFRPVMPNSAPAAAPFQPGMQNNGAAPANNAACNQAQPVQNRFAQENNASGVNPGFRGADLPRDRFTTTPAAFHSLNMGNATPVNNSFRAPMQSVPQQNAPQQVNYPGRQNVSRPMQPNPWAVPQNRIDDDVKTELLVETPKTDVRTAPQKQAEDNAKTEVLVETPKTDVRTAPQKQAEDNAKTELLVETPKTDVRTAPQKQAEDNEKTELLVEEPKTELLVEEPKTELLRESPSDAEPRTELLPENKTEMIPDSELESKSEDMPESKSKSEAETKPEPEGELLFKPGEAPRVPRKEAPKPSVAVNTAPKVGLLVCTKGENAGENFSLIAGRNRVGVSDNCDVRIKDASLTEEYNFEIIYDERREIFTLVPGKLSSRLLINNDYVDASIFMQSHDTLRTGNSEFLLVSFK